MTRSSGAGETFGTPGRVVIAGGGIAAIETLLALRAAPGGGRFAVTVVSPSADLVYRPLLIGEPFGRPLVRRYALDAICADLDATLRAESLERVDVDRREAELSSGERLPYDALVVATGARSDAALPNALTFVADGEPDEFQWVLRELETGTVRTVAFVLPAGAGWPLPLYELALLTAEHVRALGRDEVALTLVTPEDRPLAIFHGEGSDAVARLLDRAGIVVETGVYPRSYDGRAVTLTPGDRRLAAERVVALPRLTGPRIAGLPCDPEGFVRVDERGRVPGVAGTYAVGDATTFAIKQGGIAAQQADLVAEAIAADGAGARAAVPRPHLRAVLLTGGDPLYLTATITGGESVASTASRECPWWPPHKVAARHLAPFLADRRARPIADAWDGPELSDGR